jgi:hypothetical protein
MYRVEHGYKNVRCVVRFIDDDNKRGINYIVCMI